jgi:hypothetical protein
MITNNYGLKGGTLNSAEHIKRAEARLCYPSEIEARRLLVERLQSVKASKPARAAMAERN